mmetsp:Transcript_151057/g.263238  ORF Transcript_151057/g.263238 Transcript_151057/m.263238 type:complete len:229 (-) Transcript_151057:184-870(-)
MSVNWTSHLGELDLRLVRQALAPKLTKQHGVMLVATDEHLEISLGDVHAEQFEIRNLFQRLLHSLLVEDDSKGQNLFSLALLHFIAKPATAADKLIFNVFPPPGLQHYILWQHVLLFLSSLISEGEILSVEHLLNDEGIWPRRSPLLLCKLQDKDLELARRISNILLNSEPAVFRHDFFLQPAVDGLQPRACPVCRATRLARDMHFVGGESHLKIILSHTIPFRTSKR